MVLQFIVQILKVRIGDFVEGLCAKFGRKVLAKSAQARSSRERPCVRMIVSTNWPFLVVDSLVASSMMANCDPRVARYQLHHGVSGVGQAVIRSPADVYAFASIMTTR
jgi:hypothetical protein